MQKRVSDLEQTVQELQEGIRMRWQAEAELLARTQHLALLNDLSRDLATDLDPGKVNRRILAAVDSLLPGAAARLWLRQDPESETFHMVASIGLRDPEGGIQLQWRIGEGLLGEAAAAQRVLISSDIRQDPRFVNKAWAASEGLVATALIPLVSYGRLLGILAISAREPHVFAPEEIDLFRALADHAAIAIGNARLHEKAVRRTRQLARRTQQLEALLGASGSVMEGLDLTSTLNRIVVEAGRIGGTEHVKILLVDKARGVLRVAATGGAGSPRGRRYRWASVCPEPWRPRGTGSSCPTPMATRKTHSEKRMRRPASGHTWDSPSRSAAQFWAC